MIQLLAHPGDIDMAPALAPPPVHLAIDAIKIALAVRVHIDADGEPARPLGDDAIDEALAERFPRGNFLAEGSGWRGIDHRARFLVDHGRTESPNQPLKSFQCNRLAQASRRPVPQGETGHVALLAPGQRDEWNLPVAIFQRV